jgi:hypothetical protein
MKKIPLLAGKCPYCLDQNQRVHGRISLILILIVIIFGLNYYFVNNKNDMVNNSKNNTSNNYIDNPKKELDELFKSIE